MLSHLKKSLYFPIAYYFRFFAKIRLAAWKPYVIVITGSSGKTTLLHLLESQIGEKAKYSHLANSSYGISFDILGLKRNTMEPLEWIFLFFLAPFSILKSIPKQKIYIAECDTDRPGEGKFLATLLKPNVTLWANTGKTHTHNFDEEVKAARAATSEEAVAYDFGYFIEHTKELTVVNTDIPILEMQLTRAKAEIEKIKIADLSDYNVRKDSTAFTIKNKTYKFSHLLPQEFYYSLAMCLVLLERLKIKPDLTFKKFQLPQGRNRVFKGIKNITLIDSTYNATPDGVKAVLNMFASYPAENKWLVLGDMIELGLEEEFEHEKLAEQIEKVGAKKIILVGPRLTKYTYPKLKNAKKFITPKDAFSYMGANLKGGETVLFKGARFLEGIIEKLLADKKDAAYLPRREEVWKKRREKFGL